MSRFKRTYEGAMEALKSPPRYLVWPGLLILTALVGGLAMLWLTRVGPAVRGDSVVYIAGARSLLQGEGFTRPSAAGYNKPITAFPPFYSAVLASVGALSGLDPLDAARYLNAAFFALNILLLGLLVFRETRSPWPPLLVSFLFLSSKTFVELHMWAMTEGLYILLTLLVFLSLSGFYHKRKLSFLIIAGVLSALASLTRYVGLTLGMTTVLAALLAFGHPWPRRLREAFLVGLVSFLPFLLWLWRNARLGGSATSRVIVYHLTRTDIVLALDKASRWVLSEEILRRTRIILFLLFLALLFVFVLFAMRRMALARRDGALFLSILLLAFIGFYLGLFVAAAAFLDDTMNVNTRYMLPVFVTGMALLGIELFRLRAEGRWAEYLSVGVLVLGLALGARNAVDTADFVLGPGASFGYLDVRLVGSETIDAIEKLDPAIPIITNEMEKVYILTGRPSFLVPAWFNAYTNRPVEDFPQQMEAMRRRLREGAVLILFDTYDFHQDVHPARADLIVGLETVFDGADGTIYVDPSAWPEGAWADFP